MHQLIEENVSGPTTFLDVWDILDNCARRIANGPFTSFTFEMASLAAKVVQGRFLLWNRMNSWKHIFCVITTIVACLEDQTFCWISPRNISETTWRRVAWRTAPKATSLHLNSATYSTLIPVLSIRLNHLGHTIQTPSLKVYQQNSGQEHHLLCWKAFSLHFAVLYCCDKWRWHLASILLDIHTVSWLNSSVTLLVSKAPLNRTVKNGCFWVDPPFCFTAQNSGGH